MNELKEIATGLRFPEGPVAMSDGSVLVVEIERGTLSRVRPDGTVDVIATTGGGPNGAAIGPDKRCYVCNNGGFRWVERDGELIPGLQGDEYQGGRIEAIDLRTGAVEVLYTHSDQGPLRGPNDIVFDAYGGFWFTDLGKTRETDMDRGVVCYARADGTECRQIIRALVTPNGIGLSPNGEELYVAETIPGRIWAWRVLEPGQLELIRGVSPNRGRLVAGLPGYQEFDSLAVDGDGNICVATLHNGGITVAAPDGSTVDHIATPDHATTNICFGGDDLGTAFITLSSSGRLVSIPWPRPGLALNYSI